MTLAEQDAATLEQVRLELEAAMLRALPICGTQGLKTLVAGVEIGVMMRWVASLPARD